MYIVKDTPKIKEFQDTTIIKRTLVKQGGFTEWLQIVCAKDVTTEFYSDIQFALFEKDYDVEVNGKINTKTKEALVKFQKENGLPVGALDMYTLRALGINPSNY